MLHRKASKKKVIPLNKRWSTDESFSFLITGRFRNKYSAISKMIPHSLDLSPSRLFQINMLNVAEFPETETPF